MHTRVTWPFCRPQGPLCATAAIACVIGLASATPAHADEIPGGPAAAAACSDFARALDLAAANYSSFANALAIGEIDPNYTDPIVRTSNITGRTALRLAAADALSASLTPGLHPEVAAPMRSWSYSSTKLLLLMGMRANVDRINNAATELNSDAYDARMACAQTDTPV
ncbi:MAG: hypothetical protein ACPGIJ_01495 [Mycobacterium sp.]